MSDGERRDLVNVAILGNGTKYSQVHFWSTDLHSDLKLVEGQVVCIARCDVLGRCFLQFLFWGDLKKPFFMSSMAQGPQSRESSVPKVYSSWNWRWLLQKGQRLIYHCASSLSIEDRQLQNHSRDARVFISLVDPSERLMILAKATSKCQFLNRVVCFKFLFWSFSSI